MDFSLHYSRVNLPTGQKNAAFLIPLDWNDWYRFETLYFLFVLDEEGLPVSIGRVKIGQFGMTRGRPSIPTTTFNSLGERFFSLGQDENYYETLTQLSDALREQILTGLRDVAADLALLKRAQNESVMSESLLRRIHIETVLGRFHRLANCNADLSPFNFSYNEASDSEAGTISLAFEVIVKSHPPTNVHVLIGRNGVGKTRLLRKISTLLVKSILSTNGESIAFYGDGSGTSFANLVSVSFSAFDPFTPFFETKDDRHKINYSYIGLKPIPPDAPPSTDRSDKADASTRAPSFKGHHKTVEELASDFAASAIACRAGVRATRWRRALELLETDPLFQEAEVSTLSTGDESDEQLKDSALAMYDGMSSGHKIVLLTITRLVETVGEQTIVLLDEPEAHLHPPLLSAFVRALSDLLIQRNGVAIIATHSPVILQEVPRGCVWILRRTGNHLMADRPEIETFGENVGVLTREVFGLEVTESGFHKLLEEAVRQSDGDYNRIVSYFDNRLGAEARGIIRALLLSDQAASNDVTAGDNEG